MDMIEFSYYDIRKGYDNDKPQWHRVDINNNMDDFLEFDLHCRNILYWIEENIDMPNRHCRWYCTIDAFSIKFRYEKDCSWFKLRWA